MKKQKTSERNRTYNKELYRNYSTEKYNNLNLEKLTGRLTSRLEMTENRISKLEDRLIEFTV